MATNTVVCRRSGGGDSRSRWSTPSLRTPGRLTPSITRQHRIECPRLPGNGNACRRYDASHFGLQPSSDGLACDGCAHAEFPVFCRHNQRFKKHQIQTNLAIRHRQVGGDLIGGRDDQKSTRMLLEERRRQQYRSCVRKWAQTGESMHGDVSLFGLRYAPASV